MTWIEYDYVCNENKGIVYHKKVEYNEANLAIAQQEAVNGEYTITEDEQVFGVQPLAVELGGTNAKTIEEARSNMGGINTYVEGAGGLVGIGSNGKFKPSSSGTYSVITVNGRQCLVKCGGDSSVELVAGCWYTFILDGNTINFNKGGAGGSGGSELTIVGGTSRPAKATQNMIWIDTDVEITDYVLSATEPEEPVPGMVWIAIGESSKSKMAAPVSDDWITVCPLFVQQYVDGAWTSKPAKSYQGGTWVNWFVLLYNYGDVCAAVTGGWAKKNRSSSSTASGSMTLNEDNIYVKNVNNGSTGAATVAQIDLTDYSEIHCICKASKCYIGVAPAFPASSYIASGTYEDVTVDDEIVLDIRAVEGMMRICISEGSVSGMYIYKVWLT